MEYHDIKLEKVEPYSWGKRDNPVVLVIDLNNLNSMLCIGFTEKGHEDMFKLTNINENIVRITGNIKGDTIYWDIFCLRNAFTIKLNSDNFISVLDKYTNYIHKCY